MSHCFQALELRTWGEFRSTTLSSTSSLKTKTSAPLDGNGELCSSRNSWESSCVRAKLLISGREITLTFTNTQDGVKVEAHKWKWNSEWEVRASDLTTMKMKFTSSRCTTSAHPHRLCLNEEKRTATVSKTCVRHMQRNVPRWVTSCRVAGKQVLKKSPYQAAEMAT